MGFWAVIGIICIIITTGSFVTFFAAVGDTKAPGGISMVMFIMCCIFGGISYWVWAPNFKEPVIITEEVLGEYEVKTVDSVDVIYNTNDMKIMNLNKILGKDLEEGSIIQYKRIRKAFGNYQYDFFSYEEK